MEGVLECREETSWDERSPSQASPAPFEPVESDVEDDGSDSGDEIDDNDESFSYSLAKEAEFLPLADYPSSFQPQGTVPRAAVVQWMIRVSHWPRSYCPDAPETVPGGVPTASAWPNQGEYQPLFSLPRRAGCTDSVSARRYSPSTYSTGSFPCTP